MIRIKSDHHNFRRCGVAHPGGWTEYPDDRFTQEERAVLEGEKMLTVEIVSPDEDDAKSPKPARKRSGRKGA